jgi:hypothetical protein
VGHQYFQHAERGCFICLVQGITEENIEIRERLPEHRPWHDGIKVQGYTGFAATVKDYAVVCELASLKQRSLLTLRLSPSRTLTRRGLSENAKRSLGMADTDTFVTGCIGNPLSLNAPTKVF